MATELLATKLRVPPEPHFHLPRIPLVEALERDVPLHKLVSVSAPAGYGKTTLLAQWARTSRFPVAWVSLSEDDNDPERFLRYLVTAWAAVQPRIRESEVNVRLGAMDPDIDAVLSAFINVGTADPETTVFVLDDAHLIVDTAIHQAMTFLLDHLPPHLHLVLAGRGTQQLPLARYRARGELLEIHADDLRFAVDETRDFLRQLMRLDVGDDEIVRLHSQLEGWAAGLQLAALSLRTSGEARRPAGISGRHRFIADYLHEDVLAWLPEDTHQFLLQTSILDRLNGALCDAVTVRDDSQAMLESLERQNLFIEPLDEIRDWYRYHRLFADVLQQELLRHRPGEVSELHRRAARWYLEARLPEPAFQHALAADDEQAGFEIFELYANAMLNSGQLRLLQQWLDQLPATWRDRYPVFGLAEAGLFAFTGSLDACLRCVDDVEERLAHAEGEEGRRQRARVTAIRCAIACFQNDLRRAESYAERALRDLPEEDLGFRPLIYGALGDSYRRIGRWEEARSWYLKATRFTDAPTFRVESAHVFGALADLDLRQGRLHRAAGYWRKALAAVEDPENWGRLPLPVFGWVKLRLGELLYEWNDLDQAWDHLARGLELAEVGGDVQSLIAGYVISARLKLTRDDFDGAAELLAKAQPLVDGAAFPDWTSRFERCQIELWLTQGKLRLAVDWVDTALRDGTLEERSESESVRLATARVLIVKGDAPSRDRAVSLLDDLLQAAETHGRMGVQIEALALQAIAHWGRGDTARAMTFLERSLRLAEPEGYVRLFADLGLPMTRLLQEARSREVRPNYVSRLLAACGVALTPPGNGKAVLPEPLSQREQDVLGLIAAGLTNREIAESLFISPETVKKHTSSIFGKLGVGSRTQAVARARSLGFLDER